VRLRLNQTKVQKTAHTTGTQRYSTYKADGFVLSSTEFVSVPTDTISDIKKTISDDKRTVHRDSGVPSSMNWNGTRPLTSRHQNVVTELVDATCETDVEPDADTECGRRERD
jgi:hypothetical protein